MAETISSRFDEKQSFEQSFNTILKDTKLSKEELLAISDKYSQKESELANESKSKYKSLMKDALTGMLKEYTIENQGDLDRLYNLIKVTDAGYNIADINLDKSPVKVRLDQKDNQIKPLHGLQGILTSKDTSRLDVNTLLNFRNSDHVARAIDADFRRTASVAEYLEDKLALMNGDISGGHENTGFASSERAYRDIINFVTTGGAEKRASSGSETIHIRNKKEAQLVKSYLLDLINNDIPNARNKAPIETTTSPQVSPVTESNQAAITETKASPTESINRRNTLEFKASYAEKQLKIAGETVNSLQKKLKDNNFYTGDINGKFDQATLDAVVKFQESVPNIKYGPDGRVGPVTIGILFGKKQVPVNNNQETNNPASIGQRINQSGGTKPSQEINNGPKESTEEKNTDFIKSDLILMLSAVRDAIRENKKTFSISWAHQTEKARAVGDVDAFLQSKNIDALSNDKMIIASRELLDKIHKSGVIFDSQFDPFATLSEPYTSDKIRTATLSIIRASNGTSQMNNLFYSRNTQIIDDKIRSFTQQEKDLVGTEVNKVTNKMDRQMNKMAEQEWAIHGAKIVEQYPSIDLLAYTKQLKEAYSNAIQADISMKIAIKSLGATPFNEKDAVLWTTYNDMVDPLDELDNISDESWTAIANFVVYDLTSMLISGGVAGLVGRGAVMATKGVIGAERSAKIVYSAGMLNSTARIAGAGSRAIIEGTAFTALHSGIRHQEWFVNQTDPVQQIIINSLGFGLFRSANSGAMSKWFAGIENPAINGLVKQGLVVPALITGAQVGLFDYDRLADKDPSVWNDLWSNFLLNAAMGGMFHIVGSKGNNTQDGNVKLPDRDVPVMQNSDGTITMKVPGKNSEFQDVTFQPSKELKDTLKSEETTDSHTQISESSPKTEAVINDHSVQDANPVSSVTETSVHNNKGDKSESKPGDVHDAADGNNHAVNKSSYKFEGRKTLDAILLGDNRKFREIFPFTDNNVYGGIAKLTKGEMSLFQAIHNSAAWLQNQTFSQIYKEITAPWRGEHPSILRGAGDNIRTILLSGESGKWMSGDRLAKLGIVMSAGTIDYLTSDEYAKDGGKGLLAAINAGIIFTFDKYAMHPDEAIKLYQEIILLNWVAILIKESPEVYGAVTGTASAVGGQVLDNLEGEKKE